MESGLGLLGSAQATARYRSAVVRPGNALFVSGSKMVRYAGGMEAALGVPWGPQCRREGSGRALLI